MRKRGMIGISNISKNHWHPCCQTHPDSPIIGDYSSIGPLSLLNEGEPSSEGTLKHYRCPRGHDYTSSEPFVLTTTDAECNSGALCIYCYVNWLHVNLGAEEFLARD